MKSPMRILVTNDDGIHAEGLDVCEKIARELSDDVWVIAPEYDQSGVAHSLSLNDPLRLRQVAERRFAVRGTPTDCVIMGARHLLDGKGPDLLLSGVNRGRNAGEDVIYSGTVAGAVEGTVIGIPSLALSQAFAGRSGRRALLGDEPALWTRHHSPRRRRGHPARRADQRQFSRLPAGRSQAHRGHRRRGGAPARSGWKSIGAKTAAAIPITGSPMYAKALPRRRRAPILPRSRRAASRSRRCGST